MKRIENYLASKENALILENIDQTIKSLIDLTLDTQDTVYYTQMLDFLDWIDNNKDLDIAVFFDKSKHIFQTLKSVLLDNPRNYDAQASELIKLNNLTKNYGRGFFNLGPINFTLKANQIIGLVGENGNGKTTLLRLIAKELEITSGNINYLFPYQDIYDLRSKLVYIPQRTPTWRGSLLDNLRFAASCYGILGDENEMMVQLIVARMGIRKYRTLKWNNLSSGYKMRFELARALLRKSTVVLIDEPLANLDIISQKTVLDDLKGIAQSPYRPMGIILSSQQLYEVEKNADNVLFLKQGVQKNLIEEDNKTETTTKENSSKLVVEFETSCELADIKEAFSQLGYVDIELSGGTYVITFAEGVSLSDFQKAVVNSEISLNYFRDISKSTRRFFIK